MPISPAVLAVETHEAPLLAALAVTTGGVFADLVDAWHSPLADLVQPEPAPKRVPTPRPRGPRYRPGRRLELPDAPSVTTLRPLRTHRQPAPLFDRDAPPADLAAPRPVAPTTTRVRLADMPELRRLSSAIAVTSELPVVDVA